ncbi:type II secretion system F family protein [Streptomyces sp. SP17BM10]|uniref:type II secretion system F family protein n=1 Tax=Streptomyces sp. SP17BM10 TaxID=3002530 RepID=UPI002E75A99E|nr:type II secretion system F family protein [Streptomyces sp. SP17BM10]MEE1787009.1 type II secretion system F family protein [Streptomyces sp. SP17BM10]
MINSQISLWWAAALCVVALGGWHVLQQQLPGGRRSRLVLAGAGPPVPPVRPVSALGAPQWLVPELLLLPVGLAAGYATASPVPVLVGVLAVVPLRRWRLRRAVAGEARRRATGVVELCAALAGELRSGATPEQALHVVTTRTAADPQARRTLGEEPLARLAAGRYGGDVPAALHLLAELPGGSGAAAIAACWRVASDGGAGLAAALDRVAEALRGERALAEEIAGELAGPRTTIAVLAALPAAGLLLGTAMGARPVHVLLHTSAGLGCLAVGAGLEGLGVAWTARIVRAAARGGLEGPVGPGSGAVVRGPWTARAPRVPRAGRAGSRALKAATWSSGRVRGERVLRGAGRALSGLPRRRAGRRPVGNKAGRAEAVAG